MDEPRYGTDAHQAFSDDVMAVLEKHRAYLAPTAHEPEHWNEERGEPIAGTWIVNGFSLVLEWRCLDEVLPEGATWPYHMRVVNMEGQSPSLTKGLLVNGSECM